jgi:hypothetical protein
LEHCKPLASLRFYLTHRAGGSDTQQIVLAIGKLAQGRKNRPGRGIQLPQTCGSQLALAARLNWSIKRCTAWGVGFNKFDSIYDAANNLSTQTDAQGGTAAKP